MNEDGKRMHVTETHSDGLCREYRITVGASDMEHRLSSRLDQLRREVRLPGFRPGKVPAQVLRRRYAKSLWNEILQEAVSTSTQAAIEDRALRLAIQPKVELGKFEKGLDLEYTLTVELMPEFNPADLSTIEVVRLIAEPSDADVDAALQRLANAQRNFTDAPEGHTAETRDLVTVRYVGRIDGDEFEGGKAENMQVELGAGNFLPGFDEQLLGTVPGERREVAVRFPADHDVPHLAGREAVFDCMVTSVQVTTKIAENEDLAKHLGLESLDKVRVAVREQLKKDYDIVTRRRMKRDLLDELYRMHNFSLPPGLVEAEFNEIADAAKKAKGEDKMDESSSEDEISFRDIAIRRVRLGILLAEIGRRNNIEVSQDELQRSMQQEAMRYPGQEHAVLAYFRSRPDAGERFRGPILEDKVVDFVLELASVRERSVTSKELLAESPNP